MTSTMQRKLDKSTLIKKEKESDGLKYVVILTLAYSVFVCCVYYMLLDYAEYLDTLATLKLLIGGFVLIHLVLLFPITLMFSRQYELSTGHGKILGMHSRDKLSTSGRISTLMYGGAVYISSVAFFHFAAILFGAPVLHSIDQTCHFATLLSTAGILPPLIVLSPNFDEFARVFVYGQLNHIIEALVYVTTICSILGAWLGAFPVPLDWDRPWQVWPISCVIGTVLGFICGLYGFIAYKLYTNIRFGKKLS